MDAIPSRVIDAYEDLERLRKGYVAADEARVDALAAKLVAEGLYNETVRQVDRWRHEYNAQGAKILGLV